MSDTLTVVMDDVVRDVEKKIGSIVRRAMEENASSKQPIDTTDPEAIGELIRDNGWTSYDLSIDLEQFADEDALAQAVSIGAFLRENSTDEVIETIFDTVDADDVMEAVTKNADRPTVVKAALEAYGRADTLREVLDRVDMQGHEGVREVLRTRDADILKAIGQTQVMEAIKAMGWLIPVPAPTPAPADRPTWEELVAFIRGYSATK